MKTALEALRVIPFVAVLATSLAGGCAAESSASGWNLIVVLVDTLRADRMSLYGYGRATSPQIEHFARQRAIVFRNAWANAGCTFPSVNSVLTGKWPQYFVSRQQKIGMVIPPEVRTLAERLVSAGFETAAVSASAVVRATPGRFNRRGGYNGGFVRFNERCEELEAECVNRVAVEEIERLREPFFLYLHYLDPHNPYRPPPWTSRSFSAGSASAASIWARTGDGWTIQENLYRGRKEIGFDANDVRHLSDLYDDEVSYFDQQFGELVRELDERKLLGRSILVFLSDHGEELFDHGQWSHCKDLTYENVLRTPLFLAVPGLAAGWRETPVSNIDLVPTLLDLLRIGYRSEELDGGSLVSLLRRGDAGEKERVLFAAQGRSRAARNLRRRVQVDLLSWVPLFEFVSEEEMWGGEPSLEDPQLLVALREWVQRVEREGTEQGAADAEALERDMRALGYL